jgi:hypothetical protein
MDYRRHALWALVILACMALLLAPAVWNGFPLLQYDTGAYLAPWYEGKLLINRSVPYGLLLVAGQRPDFWPVLIVQSALTVWVLALTLRAHGLGQRPLLLLAIVAALCLLTTLPWLTAILLTDIFAGLAVLALYLLLLRDDMLRPSERAGLAALVAYAGATHSGTLAVLMGLTAAAALARLIDRARIPLTRLTRAVTALALAAVLVVAANGMVTGRFGWSPGGFALSFGRMLQDGIVKKYLDAHCPDATLRLCPYKNELPRDADVFFWAGGSIFNKLGRFAGYNDEMRRIVLASFADDPLLQLKSMVSETAKQLVEVRTGAGVVKWVWDTYFIIKDYAPAAVPAMQAARQQRSGISFAAINLVQVPLAWFAMALLPFITAFAWRRTGLHDIGEFAAAMAFAILGNAAVFGVFATAHNRYGARIVWLAALVVLIALARTLLNRPRTETPGLPA